jgi:hypothetical protein
MYPELMILLALLLLFLLGTFLFSILDKRDYKIEKEIKQSIGRDDVLLFLDWMLIYGIIDSKQYNELLNKSLPYTRKKTSR